MNMKNCPKCGNPMPADSFRCVNCGSLTVRLGKTVERAFTRRQALVVGLIIMLFPACALVAAGLRVFGILPLDLTSEPEVAEVTLTPETEAEAQSQAQPSNTPQEVDEPDEEEASVDPTATSTEEPVSDGPATPTLPSFSEVSCVPLDTTRQVGTVNQVFEGDHIRVRVGDADVDVRMIGVDSPPLGEPFGTEAVDLVIGLIFGKEVTLVADQLDANEEGHLLRYVLIENTFVNYELVKSGFAEATILEPNSACGTLLQVTEDEARTTEAGLWEPTPGVTNTFLPTWTWTPDPNAGKCDCEGGDDIDCNDFKGRFGIINLFDAQKCYDKCDDRGLGDYYNLDDDGDGFACE
jgi:endonuclease YncB( thermonuclease family)